MFRFLIFIVASCLAMASYGQTLCPNCGRIKVASYGYTQSSSQYQVIWANGPLGHVAQQEAMMQARAGRHGHFLGVPRGASFAGVGMSTRSANAPTCEPRRPMRLVGDAVVKGPRGYFRSRYWAH